MSETARFWVMGDDAPTFINTITPDGVLNVSDALTIELLETSENTIGIIYLLRQVRDNLMEDITDLRPKRRFPIILAMTDDSPAAARKVLPEDIDFKVFPCDPTNLTSCENVLLALIYQILS